jgi:nitrous oxidase accessory protein NosD
VDAEAVSRGTMRRKGLVAGAAAAIALSAGILASPAAANELNVHPGQRTLQRAIHRAQNGDTLRIHRGHYHGAVVVDKRLRLVGVSKRRPVIDGDCASHFTVEVNHGGVLLRHLKVIGADDSFESAEVDFSFEPSGTARGLVLGDRCDADYGINVYRGEAIHVLDNRGSGFDDSGIYIGGIVSTGGGALLVSGNHMRGNNRGVIVEDSVESTDIKVLDNTLSENDIPPGEGTPSGIFVHNSDGVRFARNRLDGNGDGSEGYGIQLDSNSDGNRLFGNRARGNDTRNLLDEGSGNCGAANSFPIAPC